MSGSSNALDNHHPAEAASGTAETQQVDAGLPSSAADLTPISGPSPSRSDAPTAAPPKTPSNADKSSTATANDNTSLKIDDTTGSASATDSGAAPMEVENSNNVEAAQTTPQDTGTLKPATAEGTPPVPPLAKSPKPKGKNPSASCLKRSLEETEPDTSTAAADGILPETNGGAKLAVGEQLVGEEPAADGGSVAKRRRLEGPTEFTEQIVHQNETTAPHTQVEMTGVTEPVVDVKTEPGTEEPAPQPDATTTESAPAVAEQPKKKGPGEITVVNDEKLIKLPEGYADRCLGKVHYHGPYMTDPTSDSPSDAQLFLLPKFTSEHLYGTIDVLVPAECLHWEGNLAIQCRAVWGTDVYTDDSDVVAMIIHSGFYRPVDSPAKKVVQEESGGVEESSELPPIVVVKQEDLVDGESSSAKNASADTQKPVDPTEASQTTPTPPPPQDPSLFPSPPPTPYEPPLDPSTLPHPRPLHDLLVTLRVLPHLTKYTPTSRHGLSSRGWGARHDGESLRVERVVEVERKVRGFSGVGRKGGVRGWEVVRQGFLERGGVKMGRGKEGVVVEREDTGKGAVAEKEDTGKVHVVKKTGRSASKGGLKAAAGSGGETDAGSKKKGVSGAVLEAEKGVKQGKHENLTIVFSNLTGEPCFKYTPSTLINWPSYLQDLLLSSADSKDVEMTDTTSSSEPEKPVLVSLFEKAPGELKSMERWALWRVKLNKGFKLYFETRDRKMYELSRGAGEEETYDLKAVTDASKSLETKEEVLNGVKVGDIEVVPEGVKVGTRKMLKLEMPNTFPPPLPSSPPHSSIKRLYLIRHGETDANASGVLQGRTTDLPLSIKGRSQGEALGKRFEGVKVDVFVVSSLKEFKDMDEISWGVYEGGVANPELKQLWADWDHGNFKAHAPEGESPFDIESRACGLIYDLLLRQRPQAQTFCFVIHGRLMRAILASLIDHDLGYMKAYEHHNTSVNVLDALVFEEGVEVDSRVVEEFRKGSTAEKLKGVKAVEMEGVAGTCLVHPERVVFRARMLNDSEHLEGGLHSNVPFIKEGVEGKGK
ncbi:hypothetical protein HDV05_007124 [Chytridiales sp. JEL 0842]|nr:hypothetical protein HDV05_007124 [Chytridiales sp. JEL 0842]